MKPTKDGNGHGGSRRQLQRGVKQIICAALTVLALGDVSAPAAENPMVGAAQRELKRQQFYTGEITSTHVDEPTREAVRRFQIRRGLKVTGELDGATLAALAASDTLAAAVSTEPPQPEEDRPPARERSQSIVRDDLDILRELEAEGSIPPPRGQEKASQPRGSSPKASSAPASASPREVIPPQVNYGSPPEAAVERRSPATPRREPPFPSTRRAEAPADISPEIQQEGIARGEILATVGRFVDSWQQPSPDRELSFYADSVNYFDQGPTPHSAIARDQRKYHQRWPEREFSLLGKPEVVRVGDDSATVRYRFRYELRNGAKSARGQAEHFVRFQRDGDGLKVVSLRERKITNQDL